MNTTPSFSDLLNGDWDALPRVERFADYLSKTGWTKVKQSDSKILVFGLTGHGTHESPILVFPSEDSYSDSKPRIHDAISTIASFQDRPFGDVLAEVLRYDLDILRQRIDVPGISGIPLKLMPEIVRSFRELVSKAAQLEAAPQGARPYCLGKASKAIQKSNEVAGKCLFGHTFAGSFGISIEMPLVLDEQKFAVVAKETPTFERLVMQRIATGLVDADNARKVGQVSVLIDNLENGFNADLCSTMETLLVAIAQIDEAPQIEYAFKWSPLIVPDKELNGIKPISFVPSEIASVFHDAANEMKKLFKTNPVAVKGEVIALADDPERKETDEKYRRTITIRCKNKGGINLVKITLSDKDYDAACLARARHNWVSVKGVLVEEGSDHRLRSPQNFKEVDTPLFKEEDEEESK